MKGFWKEFKAFISKGNIIDLATAVVIGNAFNKIVTGLVNFIVMPLISLLAGGLNMEDWKYVIKEAVLDETGAVVEAETAVLYGSFIQTIIDFLLIALSIFIVLRIIMKAKAKMQAAEIAAAEEAKAKADAEAKAKADAEAEAAAAAKAAADAAEAEKLQLLKDIRDALRK
ncbi:MAG: large conductance mechanosensitive channel protein MscL [Ruminococcaceae bacterium]|nr:large conductance mechanosensitive channel protein MscL [Oscillospiraceae bacterium]